MKPEYVIKVGNLFAKHDFIWSDNLSLTAKQHDATRFDKEGMEKAVKWFRLYEVPHTVYSVNGEFRIVRAEEIKITENV